MKFWTISTLAKHVQRCPATVRRAFKMSGVKTIRAGGGLRVADKDARRVIALQWPDVRLPEI